LSQSTRKCARVARGRIGSPKVGSIWRRATAGSGRVHVVAKRGGACDRGVLACARRRVEPPRLDYIALDVKPACTNSARTFCATHPEMGDSRSKNQPYCPIRRVVVNPGRGANVRFLFSVAAASRSTRCARQRVRRYGRRRGVWVAAIRDGHSHSGAHDTPLRIAHSGQTVPLLAVPALQ
jgi:hypothetical protein